MGKSTRITIHHTADPFYSRSRHETAAEIQRIQRFHQQERRWADIGYHYVVDRAGRIWQGRDARYQGAHAGGVANQGNIGIVVLGNYLEQGMTAVQRRRLTDLVERLAAYLHIRPSQVYTHGEIAHGKTDCPGPALTRCVYQIRAHLRRSLVAYGRR